MLNKAWIGLRLEVDLSGSRLVVRDTFVGAVQVPRGRLHL